MDEHYYQTELFTRYRIALAGLCSCCVNLSLIKEKMVNGEIIDEEKTKVLCDELIYQKESLLQAKEELGFTDGLSFMENNHFKGFEIKDGCLIGKSDLAFIILKPWYEGFPSERGINNYEFEVANYLLTFLLEQEKQSAVYKAACEKTFSKKKFKHIRVFRWKDIWQRIKCRIYQ